MVINQKGLKNLHLNIRTLKNKIADIKDIVKMHKPHDFGLSDVNLRKFGL